MKTSLTALAFICSLAALSAEPAKTGQPLPKLAPLLPGATVPNTSGKVVLVDFWASWCAPCKASFPALNRLHQKYAPKGLVIIGVGVDDEAAKYREFTTSTGAKFATVHDSKHKVADAFVPPMMPSSYLADRKGVIRYVHDGFHGAKTEKEYAQEIETLLAEH